VNDSSDTRFESSYVDLYRAVPRITLINGCPTGQRQPAPAADTELDVADIHDEIHC
jgi:hypothetical protein